LTVSTKVLIEYVYTKRLAIIFSKISVTSLLAFEQRVKVKLVFIETLAT
jgi:hypothetical protein